MPAVVQDVLKVNIVFVGLELLNAPEAHEKFIDDVGSEVIPDSVLIASNANAAPVPGRIFRLPKDRVQVDSSPMRSSVAIEYPSFDDLGRLEQVTQMVLNHTVESDQQPTAFGFNVELVYEQTSYPTAQNYLAQHIFADSIRGIEGWNLVGGSGQLIFEEFGHRWTLTMAPRLNDERTNRVFLTLNYHFQEQRVPGDSEITEGFRETWKRAHALVKGIDENAVR